MKVIEYRFNRFCFKAEVIESLDDNDIFVMHTPDGTFQMTKAEFYKTFPKIVGSVSYQRDKIHHSKKPPKKALQFLSESPLEATFIANDKIGDAIRSSIKEIGRLWRESKFNPALSQDVLAYWDHTIDEWIKDFSMPLIVRKDAKRKGQSIIHSCEREIIISDNSFAIWVFGRVLSNELFSLSQLREMLNKNEIPMMMSTNEIRKNAKYTKPVVEYALSGWKVCHIEPVGFNSNTPLEDISIDHIEAHFRKYANPKNMFILPKEIGPLGEIQLFIDEQKKRESTSNLVE